MREHREKDDLLTTLFEEEKLRNEKNGSYRLEPHLNESLLHSLAKEKKERRLIIFMVTMAMVMMDFSFVLLIAYYFTLAPWMIFTLWFLILFISGAIVLLFYGLNRMVHNKEVMNL